MFCDFVHPNVGSTYLIMRAWDDKIGIGGNKGNLFGFDLFCRTLGGLALVHKENTALLSYLLSLRFADDELEKP
jgi:hypothetical protein